MVRRTSVEAEETRDRILDAAEICFCRRGVARTTLDIVAAHAGCTRGAIYWHFSDKQDLLRQVLQRVPLSLLAELDHIGYKSPHPILELKYSLLSTLDHIRINSHLRNVVDLVIFQGACSEVLSNKNSTGFTGSDELLARLNIILALAKKNGELKQFLRTETLAFLIFSVFYWTLRNCILKSSDNVLFEEGVRALEFLFLTILSSDKKGGGDGS